MKKISTIFFLMMAVLTTWADPVSQEEAEAKAISFLKEIAGAKGVGGQKAPHHLQPLHLVDYDRLHIFNVGENEGFVIVSTDSRTKEILGYSTNGRLNVNNIPSNVKTWLEGYAKSIAALEEDHSEMSSDNKKTKSKTKENITPLIKTTWNQMKPYNNDCPYYENGSEKGYCVTGCGAVALAQVMYYHQLPATSTVIPSYTTQSLKIEMEELPAVDFDWANMLYSYGKNYTEAEGKAIAQLLRYCGQSIEMDYGLYGSGSAAAAMPYALRNYFGYDPDVRYLQRDKMEDTEWEDILYKELEAGRPVIYGGQSPKDGHIFVCDGYDDGFYHVNWGWGGYCDGYYVLDAMNPDESGTSKEGSSGYNDFQEMVIGIQPDNGIDDTDHRLMILEFDISSSMWGYSLLNNCGVDGEYDYAIGCINEEGKVINVFSEFRAAFRANSWRSRNSGYWEGYLTTVLGTGTFYITPVCKLTSQEEYQPCTNWINFLYKGVFDGYTEVITKVDGFNDEPETIIGDINGDTEVNVTDVVTLINYIAKNDFSSVDKTTLDLNGDEDVNVTDVVTLILMIGKGQ